MQQHPEQETELELKALLSADQYAKYKSQRVAYQRNQRSGRRPKA